MNKCVFEVPDTFLRVFMCIQHVNAYHKCLKQFMERFQGKYIDNYLCWFRYLEQSKKVAHK
jgi:hypothetical protein